MASISKDFGDVVDQILKEDKRYDKGAYFFIRNALDHTIKGRKKGTKMMTTSSEHVTGQELVEGIRGYALDQFGPMAITVFENWGVQRSEDFGEIVFNLVEYGVFGKTGTDTKEDFKSAVSFEEAFKLPFLSKKAKQRLGGTASSDKKVMTEDESDASKSVKRKTAIKRPVNGEDNGNGSGKKSDDSDKGSKGGKNPKEGKDPKDTKDKPKPPKA